jgi:hypothetical protein
MQNNNKELNREGKCDYLEKNEGNQAF